MCYVLFEADSGKHGETDQFRAQLHGSSSRGSSGFLSFSAQKKGYSGQCFLYFGGAGTLDYVVLLYSAVITIYNAILYWIRCCINFFFKRRQTRRCAAAHEPAASLK